MAMVMMACGLGLTTLGWILACREADHLASLLEDQSGGLLDEYVILLLRDPAFYMAERRVYLSDGCEVSAPAGIFATYDSDPSLN